MIRGRHSHAVLLLLALLLLMVTLISIHLGSTRLSLGRVAGAILGRGDWLDNLVIFDLRLPRIVLSILIGAGIATSGAVLQGITRNDLAGPDTVGTNAGSGLGMILLSVACPAAAVKLPWLLAVAAVVGALDITLLVFGLAYRRGAVLPTRLLLVGIAVGFGAHAAMLLFSLRMSFSAYNNLLSWMSGTLGSASWKSTLLVLPFCAVLLPVAFSRARVLNTLALGDDVASSLGVSVERQRLFLFTAATILTAACVAVGGHIAFLGLAAPHLARRLVGQRHGVLLPASALCGAILLLTADTLGRHLFSPIEMPAGVLVGILGGAYFLYLLAITKG